MNSTKGAVQASAGATHVPNKTERLRRHLRTHGPCTAAELSAATGVPTIRVAALLKADRHAGRVESMRDWSGMTTYRMADQLQGQIRRATEFLVRHGFKVTPPEPQS